MTNLTFKLFGAIAVMVAIYIMLYINAEKKKNTVRFMTDFADSLKAIKDYISSSGLPFCDVLCEITKRSKESREFFLYIYEAIKKEDNPTIYDVWNMATDFFGKKYQLTDKTMDVLKRAGAKLGSMDVLTEGENILSARNDVLCERDDLEIAFNKEMKITKSLSMAIGGFIILIFI